MIRLIIILASALLAVLCYYPHYLSGWLMLFALVPLFYIMITSNHILHSATYAALWGFIVYGAGLVPILVLHPLTWLGIPLLLSGITLLLGWVVFTLYFTVLLVVVVAIIHFYKQRILVMMFIVPVSWVVMEYLQSLGPLGMTIHSVAMTQFDTPFSYLSSIGGTGFVSFAVVSINVAVTILILLLYRGYYEGNIRYNKSGKGFLMSSTVIVSVGLLLFAMIYSTYYAGMQMRMSKSEKEVQVSAMQTDIIQETKWSKEMAKMIVSQLHELAVSVPKGSVLAVAPETALPMGIENDGELLGSYVSLASQKHVDYLIGSAEFDKGYRNRANLIGAEGIKGHYDKDKLVVFGEYTPFREFMPDFLSKFVLGYDDFVSGGHRQEPIKISNANIKVASMICLESIYLSKPLYQIERGGDIIAIMTNDAWYKGSTAVYRHIEMARYDALAYHRSVVFVSNRGPAAIISANGKLTISQPFAATVLTATVPISEVRTIYMAWGHLFNASMLIIFAFILGYEYITKYALSTVEVFKKAASTLSHIFTNIKYRARRSNLHSNQWNKRNNLFAGIINFFANLKFKPKDNKFKPKIKASKWKKK